jgi:cytochrome b561
VARGFHWLVVALLVVQYSTEFVLPYLLPKSAEDGITAWHLAVGPTILLVMLLRLAWRLSHPPPPPPADLPPALRLLSRATHWAFYAVLIVLPVLGWVAASAYGATPYLLGVIPLPALVTPNKVLGEAVGQVHGTVALGLLALIALHVTGALYHALVKQDGVLQRMTTGQGRT